MHPTKHVLYVNSLFSSSDDEPGLTVEGELEGREEEILCRRAREREHGRETEGMEERQSMEEEGASVMVMWLDREYAERYAEVWRIIHVY